MGTSITFTGVSVFGCIDSHTETVYVRPQPVAEFNSDALEGCEPGRKLRKHLQRCRLIRMGLRQRNTDDAQRHRRHLHRRNVQTYDITLTAYDDLGCTDTDTLTVTVFPPQIFTLTSELKPLVSP